jgi:hypothetical protein
MKGSTPVPLRPTFLNSPPVFSLPCQCYPLALHVNTEAAPVERGGELKAEGRPSRSRGFLNLLEHASPHPSMPWEFLGVRTVLFGWLTSSLPIHLPTGFIHQRGVYPSGWFRGSSESSLCSFRYPEPSDGLQVQLDIIDNQRKGEVPRVPVDLPETIAMDSYI